MLASASRVARRSHRAFLHPNSLRLLSSSGDGAEQVDFGFQRVMRGDKASLVANVFSNVASSYDVMNDLMSGGLHRCWKEQLVDTLRPFPGMQHLDVAGGTGDVAFRVLRAIRKAEAKAGQPTPLRPPPPPPHTASSFAPGQPSPSGAEAQSHQPAASQHHQHQQSQDTARPGEQSSSPSGHAGPSNSSSSSHTASQQHPGPSPHAWPESQRGSVTVCDVNPHMLAEGRKKASAAGDLASDEGLIFELGNAEALHQFPDNQFDAYTIAFGIRNVTDRQAALAEAYRVLKPGGRFLCLEFSQVSQPLLRQMYDAYSFAVIPRIGGIVAGDADSYQYLVESIRQFPDQDTFASMIEEAGFRGAGYENILGGVVAMHSGYKLPL